MAAELAARPDAACDVALVESCRVGDARAPDRPAIVFYDKTLTYRELERECERLAGFLQRECGVARGDRVALYMQNSPQFVIAFYAILRADAVVVPVNPMNLTGELDYMLRDSEASVMIASQETAANAVPLLGGKPLRHLVVGAYSDYLPADTDLPVPEFVRAPRKTWDVPGVTSWATALARGSLRGSPPPRRTISASCRTPRARPGTRRAACTRTGA